MKDRLVEVVDEVVITGQNADEKMCSCESDVVDETCSSESYGACGDGCVDVKGKIETTEEWTKIRLFKVGLTFRIKAVEYLPISSGTYLFGKCSRWSVVLKIHYE